MKTPRVYKCTDTLSPAHYTTSPNTCTHAQHMHATHAHHTHTYTPHTHTHTPHTYTRTHTHIHAQNIARTTNSSCAFIRFMIIREKLSKAKMDREPPRDDVNGMETSGNSAGETEVTATDIANTLNGFGIALVFGSNIGLLGALSFNVGDPRVDNKNGYFGVHISFALSGFLCMCLYVLLQSHLDSVVRRAGDRRGPGWEMRTLRWALAIGALACFVGMFATLSVSLPVSATFELALLVQCLSYFVTWHQEFAQYATAIWMRFERAPDDDWEEYKLMHDA
mmetsp:Transcript_30731/g.60150  ORF Transcript_30731/g.60150 Transcript_30731/m.60150 type:complete len:280 (-) Transcript_30731:87-926(-)